MKEKKVPMLSTIEAVVMDISCQTSGDSQIRVKKFQFLDTDTLAIGTKELAILTANPDSRTG